MKTTEELQSQYEKAVNDYIDAFCKLTGTTLEHWVEVGELCLIADMYLHFKDIRFAVDNNINFGYLYAWYHYYIDNPKHTISFKTYCEINLALEK